MGLGNSILDYYTGKTLDDCFEQARSRLATTDDRARLRMQLRTISMSERDASIQHLYVPYLVEVAATIAAVATREPLFFAGGIAAGELLRAGSYARAKGDIRSLEKEE